MPAPVKEGLMKSTYTKDQKTHGHPAGVQTCSSRGTEERRNAQQDKEFIEAMNEFTAKAGLLSDDPYFGGI